MALTEWCAGLGEEILRDKLAAANAELAAVKGELKLSEATSSALLLSVKNWERQCNDKCDALAAAEADRDRYLTRAVVAEAKVAKVRAIAISEQGPFLDRSEPSENENYNCGKWDAARAILAAIGGKP